MRIALAQIRSIRGNLANNIVHHLDLIKAAASHGASAIFFPELSLINYEPSLAADLASTRYDSQFDVFQHLSDQKEIAIGVGMPCRTGSGIQISMFIFQPMDRVLQYSKQLLHADELPFFIPGNEQLIIGVQNFNLAPAICYESLQLQHAERAIELDAEIYIASVAKPEAGLSKAALHYSEIAKKFAMPVLMVNSIGQCEGFNSAGRTAVWNSRGILLGELIGEQEGLLLFDLITEAVEKQYCF